MPKFNPELFKTLISNFVYIQSKHRKQGNFILFQKYQEYKENLPQFGQFPSISIFGHVTCHVTIIKR